VVGSDSRGESVGVEHQDPRWGLDDDGRTAERSGKTSRVEVTDVVGFSYGARLAAGDHDGRFTLEDHKAVTTRPGRIDKNAARREDRLVAGGLEHAKDGLVVWLA
jgi:hypothetical protein